MKVFLTGATGFVGSHVARQLLAAGCAVTALVRPGSSLARLEGVTERLALVRGELADRRDPPLPWNLSLMPVCIWPGTPSRASISAPRKPAGPHGEPGPPDGVGPGQVSAGGHGRNLRRVRYEPRISP